MGIPAWYIARINSFSICSTITLIERSAARLPTQKRNIYGKPNTMFTTILPEGASQPIAPYAHATKAGNTVYVSGTLAIDPDGKSLHVGDMEAQTRYVIEQIKGALEAAGASLEDIAYNAIFIKQVSDYGALNEVYSEYFGKKPPARYCIVTELVRDEFLVEISSIAHIGPA